MYNLTLYRKKKSYNTIMQKSKNDSKKLNGNINSNSNSNYNYNEQQKLFISRS